MPVYNRIYIEISKETATWVVLRRDVIKLLCKYKKVEIIEGAVYLEYVHLCVRIPSKMSVSYFMGYLKGKSTLIIYDRHLELKADGAKHSRKGDTMYQQWTTSQKKHIQEQLEESKKDDDRAAF